MRSQFNQPNQSVVGSHHGQNHIFKKQKSRPNISFIPTQSYAYYSVDQKPSHPVYNAYQPSKLQNHQLNVQINPSLHHFSQPPTPKNPQTFLNSQPIYNNFSQSQKQQVPIYHFQQ